MTDPESEIARKVTRYLDRAVAGLNTFTVQLDINVQ
jgi:hypothetical protein